MQRAPQCRWVSMLGALAAVCVIAAPLSCPADTPMQPRAVRLAAADATDFSLGDGVALIMGGSGYPNPAPKYADTVNSLFLQPHGFTGTPQILYTPAGFYPTTGVKSLPAWTSELQGAQILEDAIHRQIATGAVDADNPVVVFGYSQSAALSALTMHELQADGVSPNDVFFVLIGNTANPNGGLLTRFDAPIGTNPSIPSFGIEFGNPTPDLYPTNVYTLEYDGFADFPKYPINLLADLNAFAGMIYQHFAYLGLTPEQIANAVPLETTGDGLTNYFMIPSDGLPLLEPLRLVPILGQPLYDLLEPVTRILVNLGYGSITDGWASGPANVETPFELFPTDLNWSDVPAALFSGALAGAGKAWQDLWDPATYQITPLLDNPSLATLEAAAYGAGLIDTPHPDSLEELLNSLMGTGSEPTTPSDGSLASFLNDLGASLSDSYSRLLPILDTVTALSVTLPAYDLTLFLNELEAGDWVDAIGLPYAANMALIPLAILLGLM